MQEKAVFHLIIPNLLDQLNIWFRDFSFEAEAPYFSSLLLQQDRRYFAGPHSIENSFFKLLDSEIEELPIAYYRHQVQNNTVRDRVICADPVHLEVGMNDVSLTSKISDLIEAEAKELISILNAHFKEDGLEFLYGPNNNWYISFEEDENIESHTLDSMLMKNIFGKLAKSGQRNWQVIQNETQMLLHTSEINQQREMAGLETVNSLWFWGAGKPITPDINIDNIYIPKTATSTLRAEYFAKAANCEWDFIPNDIDQLLSEISNKKSPQIILLEQLFMPVLEDNIDEFQQQLTQIDQQIIKPLLEAWKNNQIEIEINGCDGTIFSPRHPPFYKFWLKPRKLREISRNT